MVAAVWRPDAAFRQRSLMSLEGRLASSVRAECRRLGQPLPVAGGTAFGGVENKLGLSASGSAVANSTSEASLLTREMIRSLSTDYFAAIGQRFRFTAHGVLSTTGTPTIQFKFRMSTAYASPLAGNMICQSAAITTGSGVANVPWWIDILGTVRATGQTGTVLAVGRLYSQIVTATTGDTRILNNATPPTAVSQDLSVPQFIDLTATWGTANASNTLQALDASWESLN